MKITVITVCLNSGEHLSQTLASVGSQSWQDIEHIVVDGGSQDTTLDILREAAENNPKLRFSSEPDNGISDAMNKGIALATGEVVAFLHADDFYADSNVLAEVAAIFEARPDIEWVTGGLQHVAADGNVIRRFPVRRWSYQRLLRGNILFHPATFVRRCCFEAVGGFEAGLRYVMDYDLWLRLGRRSSPYLIDRPLACFRLHSGSVSVKSVDAAFREELQVRLQYLQGKPLHKALHRLYFILKLLPNRQSVRCRFF